MSETEYEFADIMNDEFFVPSKIVSVYEIAVISNVDILRFHRTLVLQVLLLT